MKMTKLPLLFVFMLAMNVACDKKTETDTKKDTAAIDTTKSTKKEDGPELVWSSDTTLTTCESAMYDKGKELIYVSCINGKPDSVDNNGFIARLTSNGKIENLKWATGLSAPKGLGLFNGKVYVTDITSLVEIDANSGKILKKYPVAGAKFLNDVAVSEDGAVYFTDSETGKIHKLNKGKVETWKDGLQKPNGMSILGDNLYLASMGSSDFRVIDMKTKKDSVLVKEIGMGDGVEYTENGSHFIVSDWNGQVFLVKGDGSKTSILDTKGKKVQSADIEYIADEHLLLVPTFFSNRVDAYKVKVD